MEFGLGFNRGGAQSGLLMRIGATESVTLDERMKR
jgi:hypothetical protein